MSKEAKARKPRARPAQIVLGALEENIRVLEAAPPEFAATRVTRMLELVDELRRSMNKDNGGDGE